MSANLRAAHFDQALTGLDQPPPVLWPSNGNSVSHTLSQPCVFPMQGERQIADSVCYNPGMEPESVGTGWYGTA